MSCSGQTNYYIKMQIQCTVTNDTHKNNYIYNPFTTTIVITDASVVKSYTCHHKTITSMSYNVMGPVTLLHRALLQRPFFGRSKAPFLTNSVGHSRSLLVRIRTGS